MLTANLVSSEEDLLQIHTLNLANLRQNLTPSEPNGEGFVSWLYPASLLLHMHRLAPSIVVKDEGRVIAYALVSMIEARVFHSDLDAMFRQLEKIRYRDRPLFSYRFYCMGQICIDRPYRGKGLFALLYEKHREIYGNQFDFVLTEIATGNPRSMKAHAAVGFTTIHTYRDALDEWNVVVWDWQ